MTMVANATGKVVVLTTTFYQDDDGGRLRRGLAGEFFRRGSNSGYTIVSMDGNAVDGNLGEFGRQIQGDYGINVFPETQRGLGPSRREAVSHAFDMAQRLNRPYLFWTEPEKIDIFAHIDKVVGESEKVGADAAIIDRGDLRDYPIGQQSSEKFGARLYYGLGFKDFSGAQIDRCCGPLLWKIEHTPYFLVFGSPKVAQELAAMRLEEEAKLYNLDIENSVVRSNALRKAKIYMVNKDHMMHMPFDLMFLKGHKMSSVPVGYKHPEEQTAFEDEEARLKAYDSKRLMQIIALTEQSKLVQRLHAKGALNEDLEAQRKRLGLAA